MTVGFDLESRSRSDLKKVGSWKYIEDPTTGLICFAYSIDEAKPKLWWPGDPDPTDMLDAIENGDEITGWNIGGFDIPFWNRLIAPAHNWPLIRWEQAHDTMARAAMMNLPQKLEHCAKALGMPEDQQKDKRGAYLIRHLCKMKKRRKGGVVVAEYFDENPVLMKEMGEYCGQELVTERALAKKLKPLPERERRFWVVTQIINARGVPIAVNEAQNALNAVAPGKLTLDKAAVKLARQTGGTFDSLSQGEKVRSWVRSRGVHCESLDAEHVEEFLGREEELPKEVFKVIKLYSDFNSTSISKYKKMLEMACEDGTVKGGISYHGASTGRDASRGLNLQNVARPPRSMKKHMANAIEIMLERGDGDFAELFFGDKVVDAAVACVRGTIKAPPGKTFRDVDYSSIENRVGSWIAGHTAKLEMFRNGLDEYKTFASNTMFRVPYEEVTDDQRQFCKPIILGGIFGQGAKGMVDYAKKYGVILSLEKAKAAVDAFREEYKPIQRMWYACGDAAVNAVENPGDTFRVGRHLHLKSTKRFLMMQLPSGRVLRWFEPRIEMQVPPWGGDKRPVVTVMGVDTYTRTWRRHKIIGSSFYQSSVQATAADIMREGTFRLEAAGYPLVMRIHDEFLAMTDEDWGSHEEMVEIISQPIDWCLDLPIAGEGWSGRRFRK